MAKLELLASGPGTGKTNYCIELFRKEILKSPGGLESRAFFVLPNREHSGRIQNLVLKKEVPGLFNVHILTIHDLTQRFLGHKAAARPSEMFRQTLLREILESPDGTFPYFNAVKDLTGFHKLFSETVQEFKSALLGFDEFEKRAQPLLADPVFRAKYRDFSMVMKRYEEKLKERGLSEPEDNVVRLEEESHDAFERTQLVIFDGFYHFTKAQQKLVEIVSSRSLHVVVSLTMPANCTRRPHVFEYPERTRSFLLSAGFRQTRLSHEIPGRSKDKALRHLEENLFLVKPSVYEKKQSSVQILEAETVRGEMECIAREIRRLHREEAYHYSDFCVIFRSFNGLEKTLQSVFADYELPVLVHERKKMPESGLIRFLVHFIRLVLEGWKREDLYFLIRSNYWTARLSGEDALVFEREAASSGILEGCENWLKLSGLANHSAAIPVCLSALAGKEQEMLSAKSSREFCNRFLRFASELESFDRGGRDRDAAALSSLRELTRSFDLVFGSRKSFAAQDAMKELQNLFDTGLFSMSPTGKNRVQVYDAVMALPKEYKVVFIGGLSEGAFPKQVTEHALFKDHERRILNGQDPVLEERRSRLSGEHYFFYVLTTRASKQLYLSYPLKDSEARPTLPSYFIQEVRACFSLDSFSVVQDTGLPALPEDCQSLREAERALGYLYSLEKFSGEHATGRFKQIIDAGNRTQEAVLRDERILQRFAQIQGPFSATRLETFVTCAFKYFSKYTLGLEESPGARERQWMGSLLHDVLEAFFNTQNLSIDPQHVHSKLNALLNEHFSKSPFSKEPLFRQNLYRQKMRRTLSSFAKREAELSARRQLRPTYFETAFGKRVGRRAAQFDYLTLGSGLQLEGALDRVDVSHDGKQGLVIDYKLGRRDLHQDLKKGLELQLPIYLLAAQRVLNLEVLGAELRFLEKAEEQGIYEESARAVLGFGPQKKLKSESEFRGILENAESEIEAAVKKLRDGEIAVRSKSCDYCAYNALCRFETWRLIYSEIEFES